MKKVFWSFLFGAATGVIGYWYVDHHREEALRAQQALMEHVEAAAQSIGKKFEDISAQTVKDQLARSGVYIVEKAKAAGTAVADAATDARITASVKSKLFSEPGFTALSIHVDASGGVVTLSGTAATPEQIARAVELAAGTDGVRRVISTLQIKEPRIPPDPAEP
ncbi:MAG: BON domain-containing protein [Verrucomicrobia bacterium]|nr:BON domain-containing protein [Verrucomicrobiota bacterium]